MAVLLATYYGARFVGAQLASLTKNTTPFTLHWLDDQSADRTRAAVRAAASKLGIDLREWHQERHQGLPSVFFKLLECADADIYLFCDQDDVWQPGKIDATVANLLPDVEAPVLCWSDALMFNDGEPSVVQKLSNVLEMNGSAEHQESRLFLFAPAAASTIGFTRPLRDALLRHREIACSHAFMHDWWMYLVAQALGTPRMIPDAPTTLYRQHKNNVTRAYVRFGVKDIAATWRLQSMIRRGISRQAEGFILASSTLPQGPKLDRLLSVARLVAQLNRRQSPVAFIRLARRSAMWRSRRRAAWLAAACLSTDAA